MMCLHVMVLPRLLSLPRPRKTLVHELSLHKASPPLSKAQDREYAQGQGTVQVWARASIPASLYDKQQCKQQTPPTELKGDPTEQGDASTWPSPGVRLASHPPTGRKACEADTEACLCTAELEAEAEGAKVTCGHTVSSSPAWAIVHPPPPQPRGPGTHCIHARTHTREHTHTDCSLWLFCTRCNRATNSILHGIYITYRCHAISQQGPTATDCGHMATQPIHKR